MMSVFEAWMSALRATKCRRRRMSARRDRNEITWRFNLFSLLSLPRPDESRVRMPGRRCGHALVAAALCCACVGVAGIELDDVMAALPAETRALLSKQNAEVMAMTDTICAP